MPHCGASSVYRIRSVLCGSLRCSVPVSAHAFEGSIDACVLDEVHGQLAVAGQEVGQPHRPRGVSRVQVLESPGARRLDPRLARHLVLVGYHSLLTRRMETFMGYGPRGASKKVKRSQQLRRRRLCLVGRRQSTRLERPTCGALQVVPRGYRRTSWPTTGLFVVFGTNLRQAGASRRSSVLGARGGNYGIGGGVGLPEYLPMPASTVPRCVQVLP